MLMKNKIASIGFDSNTRNWEYEQIKTRFLVTKYEI